MGIGYLKNLYKKIEEWLGENTLEMQPLYYCN